VVGALARDGVQVLPPDAGLARWAAAARDVALAVAADPAEQQKWLRHGGTWFVGVDALPNAPDGSIGGVALPRPWAGLLPEPATWHPAQLSVVYPGYPRQDPDESDAAHRFRRDRDAAHVDGLIPEGPARRRHLREPHAFILGLPLTEAAASPLVVWEGSPEIMRRAFARVFDGVAPARWGDVDVTDAYQAARRDVFETCPRREIAAGPGQAVLVHRLAVHGVAPWGQGAAPPEGRMVAYFRPILDDPAAWLAND